MNREVKFRAWVERNDLFGSEAYMAVQGSPDIETLQSFMHHYSDEKNLMQYTGLKDKDGKEIYEGDILKGITSDKECHVCQAVINAGLLGKEVIGFVSYATLYAQFYFTTDEIIYLDLCFGIREYEVIGNIYENAQQKVSK